jgi:hypothetical protein
MASPRQNSGQVERLDPKRPFGPHGPTLPIAGTMSSQTGQMLKHPNSEIYRSEI